MKPVTPGFSFDKPKKRKPKALKVFGIIFLVLFGLAVLAYAGGCFYFIDRFWPNTTMGTMDVSLMTSEEAKAVIDKGFKKYSVEVSGQGLSFTITPEEAGLTLDEDLILEDALDDHQPWMWPFELQKAHDKSSSLTATHKNSKLSEMVLAQVDQFNATATQPISATIAFSSITGAYEVAPEQLGTALDGAKVLATVEEAVGKMQSKAMITASELQLPPLLRDEPALKTACDAANLMITADIPLLMGGLEVARVGGAEISSWITLAEDYTATLDDNLLVAWVDDLSARCTTVGTERTYTRADGKVITVSGGVYGWEVDRDALLEIVRAGVAAGQQGAVDIPLFSSGDAYNGAGQRDWGLRYCDIDLAEQHARLYDENGALIWESDIITGTPDGLHDTPSGVWWMNRKASPSKLIGYLPNGEKEYETQVSYWMPFVGNAIGLHDATWQPGFGGQMYRQGYGSHGCVNLPYSAAQDLYSIIWEADCVVTHW